MKNHELDTARAYIVGKTPQGELLAQLAEEATELAHAALKLRRAQDGTSPTPVPQSVAFESLLDEVADVALLVELLHLDQYEADIQATMYLKTLRWADRLHNGKADEVLERAADETRY